MTQLHFTVDEKTAKRLAHKAKERGMSLSKYLATLVTTAEPRQWPEGYLQAVVGSCAAAPLTVPADLTADDIALE